MHSFFAPGLTYSVADLEIYLNQVARYALAQTARDALVGGLDAARKAVEDAALVWARSLMAKRRDLAAAGEDLKGEEARLQAILTAYKLEDIVDGTVVFTDTDRYRLAENSNVAQVEPISIAEKQAELARRARAVKQDAQRVEELTASVTRDLERGEFLRKLEGFTERFGDVVIGPDGELSETAFTDKLNAIGYGRVKGLPGVDEKVDQLRQQLSAPAAQIAPLEAPPVAAPEVEPAAVEKAEEPAEAAKATPAMTPIQRMQANIAILKDYLERGLDNGSGLTVNGVVSLLNVSRSTAYRYLERLAEANPELITKEQRLVNSRRTNVYLLKAKQIQLPSFAPIGPIRIFQPPAILRRSGKEFLSQVDAFVARSVPLINRIDIAAARCSESKKLAIMTGLRAALGQLIDRNSTPEQKQAALGAIEKCVDVLFKFNTDGLTPQQVKELERAKTALLDNIRGVKEGGSEAILNAILPAVFAITRNAAADKLDKRPYSSQVDCGIALHFGLIAKLLTGEGKTLTAAMPAVLNAMVRQVHIYTRDYFFAWEAASDNAALYTSLGFRVGIISQDPAQTGFVEIRDGKAVLVPARIKDVYSQSDIIHGSDFDYGFDYLKNTTATDLTEQAQRPLRDAFAIVDEVDAVTIDEARTPQILSRPCTDEEAVAFIAQIQSVDQLMGELIGTKKYYKVEVKDGVRIVTFTEAGQSYIEKKLNRPGLFKGMSVEDVETIFALNNALRAYMIMARGRDYIITVNLEDIAKIIGMTKDGLVSRLADALGISSEEVEKRPVDISRIVKALNIADPAQIEALNRSGKVTIIAGYTGRQAEGSRWSGGLHEAIEAKERVEIGRPSRTLATITRRRLLADKYGKLAGMTGTPGEAETKEGYYRTFYGLDTYESAPNTPVLRQNMQDRIYETRFQKFAALITEIITARESAEAGKERPILAGGTISVSEAQALGALFNGRLADGTVPTNRNLASRLGIKAGEVKNLKALLKGRKIKVNVLDASIKGQERDIVDTAGQFGAVTIATGMAGRGTDVKTPPEVLEAGGLYVIGGQRTESRRIDDQFEGRGGRQGQRATCVFFVSLEDDLFRHAQPGTVDLIKKLLREGKMDDAAKLVAKVQRDAEESAIRSKKNAALYDTAFGVQLNALEALMQELRQNRADLMGFGVFGAEHDLERNTAELVLGINLDINQVVRKLAGQIQAKTEDMEDDEAAFIARRILINVLSEHKAFYGDEDNKQGIMEAARSEAKGRYGQNADETAIQTVYLELLQEHFRGLFNQVIKDAFLAAQRFVPGEYSEQYGAYAAGLANAATAAANAGAAVESEKADLAAAGNIALERYLDIGKGVRSAILVHASIRGFRSKDELRLISDGISMAIMKNSTLLNRYFDFGTGVFDAKRLGKDIKAVDARINGSIDKIETHI
ncbi:MAG: hypothetical protein ABH825_04605, partial [Candidatus Omnitrophota bacterium]